MIKGQIISGDFSKVIIRQKSEQKIELGELLITETEYGKVLMQVFDLVYGSQLSQTDLELVSGLKIEEETNLEFMDPDIRNYTLALLKPLITITEKGARLCKTLPKFFSDVKEVSKEDIKFMTTPKNPLFVGKLRSGSKKMGFDVFLQGEKVFSHHILIPATTGRGKSNLTSCMLWNTLEQDYCGVLVLDPHDEYYGRDKPGLKDHPSKEKLVYYTPSNAPPGCRTLKINLNNIKPMHFNGVVRLSDPQKQAMNAYHRKYGERWIESIILEKPLGEKIDFMEGTMAVVRRKIVFLLDLEFSDSTLFCKGIFDIKSGESTISDIVRELETGNTAIIDTSGFSGAVEILIGSLITTEIFNKYKSYKKQGRLKDKPVISVVLEEAPRVLGKDVLEQGSNIFSTIAREGRKFKVGLTAITQLPSLIPRQILANMNTKIILGVEMASERQAIIESASQDLSSDNRNIASLDVGEAIITSNFTKFAIPIKIPLFDDLVKEHKFKESRNSFNGVRLR